MGVYGNFYFEILPDGTLNGEYFDNTRLVREPESAIPAEANQRLIGDYNSTWSELGQNHNAILRITREQSPWNYRLIWIRDGNIVYRGNGYFRDGKLEGHYEQV